MRLCVLMPTFGRTVELIQNAIACFEAQAYLDSFAMILDDEGWWHEQTGRRWQLVRAAERAPDLGSKYNWMVGYANRHWTDWTGQVGGPDAFVVWDDDDIYLPHHLACVAEALANHEWAHPAQVWSTYTGTPAIEAAYGRFHGSLAVRSRCAEWVPTRRATFDQEMLAKLARESGLPGRPDDHGPASYCFRWADTGSHHCQAFMRSGSDETWYDRYAEIIRERRRDRGEYPPDVLRPRYDLAAEKVMAQIAMLLARFAR